MVQHNGVRYKEVMEVWDNRDYILEICRLLQLLGHDPKWIVCDRGDYALIYYN